MPQSVIDHVAVDRVLPLDEIGPAITLLTMAAHDEEGVPEMDARDCDRPDVADIGTSAMKDGQLDGPPSRFTCPECGGALWEVDTDGAGARLVTYRCHVGHGYTAEGLMAAQTRALEEALWSGLRALEESSEMRRRMARRARSNGLGEIARRYEEDAAIADQRADAIRGVLTDGRAAAPYDSPDEHDRVERVAQRISGNGGAATGKSKRKGGGAKAKGARGAGGKAKGRASTPESSASGRRRRQKGDPPVPRRARPDTIVSH
jgi:two-component system chemotaxis response regulator CheB